MIARSLVSDSAALRSRSPVAADGVAAHLVLVDRELRRALREVDRQWVDLTESGGILGPDDVPALIVDLLHSGGKRIRPTMCYLGWSAARGTEDQAARAVVTAGAALELLHLFALVHDDVMDQSDTRRGRPTAHRRAAHRHRTAAARGDPELFGESIAILVGDLALAEAAGLAATLPAAMRPVWRQMVIELVAGQRQDLTGTAAGCRDLPVARRIATLKSGRYTVQRPLELGATAAGAPDPVLTRLRRYGQSVGEAFALRDDILGLWGDPVVTGKPAGDDLVTGKPTVLLALATGRVRSPAIRAALDRVGTAAFTDTDLAMLLAEFDGNGTRAAVETMIDDAVARARDAVDGDLIEPDAAAQLTALAQSIAWRSA